MQQVLLAGLLLIASSPAQASPELDQGIWLALTGRLAEAESTFATRLTVPRDEIAARNNLGNIHLLRGEFDQARVAYDSVLERKPDEAGTTLNRGLLEFLSGDSVAARRDAFRGLMLAGGEAEAEWLMGVRQQPGSLADRQRPAPLIGEARIRELLAIARRSVPPDTTHACPLRPTTTRPASGPGATRPLSLTTTGARGGVDEARVLYWSYGDR